MKRIFFTLIFLALAVNCWGATPLYVSPNGDDSDGTTWPKAYNNLKDAIDNVDAGGTVYVLDGYTYTLTANVPIAKEVTIKKSGSDLATLTKDSDLADWGCVIEGGEYKFAVNGGGDAVFQGLKFQNFTDRVFQVRAAGGVDSDLAIRYCAFYNNTSTSDGGAIEVYVSTAGNTTGLEVKNSLFDSNYTAAQGGAIAAQDLWTMSLIDCKFTNNRCTRLDLGTSGGAVHGSTSDTGESVATITRCTFDGNYLPTSDPTAGGSTYNNGGQIRFRGNSATMTTQANYTDCVFKNGRAEFGGSTYYSGYSHGTVTRCLFENNYS